ncbi:MAG: hypothetical protein NVSMB6_29970 [Burkholderiaceae bacterium]
MQMKTDIDGREYSGDEEPVRLPHRRTDWYSARTVDQGVELQARKGTQAAAAFLKSNSIVADITIRALLHPERRRGS